MSGKYGPQCVHQLGGSQQLHVQLDWSLTLKGDLNWIKMNQQIDEVNFATV